MKSADLIAGLKRIFFVTGIILVLFVYLAYPQKLDISRLKNMKARSIGPAGMSGRIVAIDAVNANPGIIYAGAASGGVWKSTDGGITWKPVFDNGKIINIGAIKICQANPDVVWVGTGEGNPRNSINIGGGIYKSPDAGKTWKCMGLEASRNIHRILVDPRDENVVYAGVIGNPYGEHPERGVFKTTDGGETWQKILYVDEKTGVGEMVMDPANPNKLFVNMWEHRRWPWFFTSGGKSSGLYVTLDCGKTWKKLDPKENGIPGGDLGRMGLAVAPSDPRIVYALIESKKNALYKSVDGGNAFSKINESEEIGNRPFYYYELYVDPKDPKRVYSLHTGISMSEDGGKSFTNIEGGTHSDHHAFWIDPNNPAHLMEGNDGGMNISLDYGKTWRFVENLPVGQFYHIRVDNNLPYRVYGGMQDNGSWVGPGYVWKTGGILNDYWQEVMFGDGFDVMPDPENPDLVYAMSQQGNVGIYNLQTGQTYTIKPTAPDLKTKLRFHWNSPIEQDPFDPKTIYYGSQFLHISTDKGLTWEIISPDLTTNDTTKQQAGRSGGLTYDVTGAENHTCLLTIAPGALQKGVIWVGTDDGNLQLTQDGGKTWQNVAPNLPGLPKGSWIPQVRTSRHSAAEAWVVANNYRNSDFTPYAYHTTDFGKTWERIADNNTVFGYALCILQDPVEPNLVFLGTEHGLWVSIDKGKNWVRWTHGFPAVSTMDLDIQEREADLIIGTFGRSIYILDDIRPLRKIASTSGKIMEQALVVFTPAEGILVNGIEAVSGTHFPADAIFSGDNKSTTARIKMWVRMQEEDKKEPAAPDDKKKKKNEPALQKETPAERASGEKRSAPDSIKIKIINQAGETIKTITQKPDTGFNVIAWRYDEGELKMPTRGTGTTGRRFGGSRQRSSKTVLPGTYKIIAHFKDFKDSTTLVVLLDPRLPLSVEALTAQRVLIDTLSARLEILYNGTQRLIESKEIVSKISGNIKGLEGEAIKELQKSVRSVTDSITAVQDFIFGKENPEAQGITPRADVTAAGKAMEALRYIASRPGMPTATEDRLVAQSKELIAGCIEKINRFYQTSWPEFRTKAEKTDIQIFKDYEPLK